MKSAPTSPSLQPGSKPRVALGMSGGVDSSVCAHLLVEQGYDVTGVFLECWRAPGCRSEEDRKDALKVALELNIPFQVLDFKDAYKQRVVEYFFDEYAAGLTPNPDVMCNKEIKFGLFYEWAMAAGFDFVATGHYSKVQGAGYRVQGAGDKALIIPADKHKDQTYFLYLLEQEQLDHILFPLGDMTKPEVRMEAAKRGLHNADKKDSVGICFIGDINVHSFLKERLGENPGEVVDTKGHVIGKHTGLWFYTIGQRHGFTIEATTLVKQDDGTTVNKHNLPPFYVIGKKPAENQLVVGFGSETLRSTFSVRRLHLINEKDRSQLTSAELAVRIRHTGQLLPCRVEQTEVDVDTLTVTLDQPAQGVAEGQSAVFYAPILGADSDISELQCLGGGIIAE